MLSVLLASLIGLTEAERQVVVADYAVQAAAGNECRYIELLGTTEHEECVVAIVTNLATRQSSIEAALPQQVPDTNCLRISLTALGWRAEDWASVYGKSNAYALGKHDPLIVKSHDYLMCILDGRKSDAYLRFLFSGQPPKTAKEFLKSFGVDQDQQGGLEIIHPEDSEVNSQEQVGDTPRLVRFDDGINSYAFSTYDVAPVREGADPVEPFAGFVYDGNETFVLFPKVCSKTGERSAVPAMFLSSGKGTLVKSAPTNLVIDHGKTFGIPDITSIGSCLVCHAAGPQRLGLNQLRRRLEAGVNLSTYTPEEQYKIDTVYLASMDEQLGKWERDWEVSLLNICGLEPKEASAAVKAVIDDYLAPITLERAALEHGVTAEDLKAAIGYASSQDIKISGRVAGLPYAIPMPRSRFEDEYDEIYALLKLWRSQAAGTPP